MSHSSEYEALVHLGATGSPEVSHTGDMWLCQRLGIVKVFTGHKRGQWPRTRLNSFHLYHWHKLSLIARPCDWRDHDQNACGDDPATYPNGERWLYIGNIAWLLPYKKLVSIACSSLTKENQP